MFRRDKSTPQIAGMFRNLQKFWATNDGGYLDAALIAYFKLRPMWLAYHNPENESLRLLTGWADKPTIERIAMALPDVKWKSVFRPDVWYLRGGQKGMFLGFRLTLNSQQMGIFNQTLKNLSLVSDDHSVSEVSLATISHSEKFRLESIGIVPQRDGKDWLTSFYISPKDFTWLVEASADKIFARYAIERLSIQDEKELSTEVQKCLAVLHLVASTKPEVTSIGSWRLKEISSPEWIPVNGDSSPEAQSSKVPNRYFTAKNLSVFNGGILELDNKFIDWDKAQHPSLDFVAGNTNLVVGTCSNNRFCFVRESDNVATIEKGIVLGSRVDSNWFHFLIETLPRLLVVENTLPKDIPVIISSRIPSTAREALGLLTGREVIAIDATNSSLVKSAFVPGPVIYHPDTQFLWGDASIQNINIPTMRRFREKILGSVSSGAGKAQLYWPRSSRYRTVTNSRRLERFLAKRGFRVENPGDLKFKSQVESIHSSSRVVAVGGALMSNFLFASQETHIIVLVSDFGKSYPWPTLLGSVSGAKITMVGGRVVGLRTVENVVEKSHASFATRIQDLKVALSEEP